MTISCVWDLHRGDYDDNRTSPRGRGLQSVVLSAVLEFNYLTAPLAFLALVLGPTLLLGIAPSAAITAAHLMYRTAFLSGSGLIVALSIFIVLVLLALRIGRPLLAMAFAEFRHLHYSLVFPIFVAVREIVHSLLESFGGETMTPLQLDRRRRIGTVLAMLLFASAGLALALSVEFSTGLKLVNVERVQLWVSIKAALGNAALIIGVSTVLESFYWMWRELTLAGPVLDWIPSHSQGTPVRVAHLSDLHLVGERYGYRMEAGTFGPRGNGCILSALRKLAALQKSAPLDRILVTGDVTDAGTRAEWTEFVDLFREFPELQARLSFVPGNHDVNIVDRTNPARLDLPWSSSQWLRKLRVVLALDAIQGERAHIVDRASGTVGPSLHDYLREGKRLERLRALAGRGTILGRREMAKTWEAIFPLVEPAPNAGGYGLILLDSNAQSHFSLTNALGVVNPSQLRALKSVLRNSIGRSWIVLLHHAIVEYPCVSMRLRDRIGLALVNAPDIVATIAPYAARVLVFHGHRHKDWIGTCGEVVLCSAPSAALGSDEHEEFEGQFHIHELTLTASGGILLGATQHVKVA